MKRQSHKPLRAAHIAQILLALVCALITTHAFFAQAIDNPRTPADTDIINRADATYEDSTGQTYSTVSQTVTVRVIPVPALNVTPDETASSANVAPHERITRLFRICNTGNTPDLYTLTRADATAPAAVAEIYFDTDDSGTITDGDRRATLNETMSPRLAQGACLGVLVVVDTNGVAPQTQLTIRLTARSNVTMSGGASAQDDGTIINAVGQGARLTDPQSADLPPTKLVENLPRFTASEGQTLSYTINFRNTGGVSARNVRVADDLPAQLEYVAGSLQLDGRALTDAADADEGAFTNRRIEARVSEVRPDQLIQVRFQARLTGAGVAGAGVINTAIISADNVQAGNSTTAVVIANPLGAVFAGHSGGAARISGARVTVATDEAGTPLQLPRDAGASPNSRNDNPFITDGQGHFNFALAANQIGAAAAPARYFVTVTAQGYRASGRNHTASDGRQFIRDDGARPRRPTRRHRRRLHAHERRRAL